MSDHESLPGGQRTVLRLARWQKMLALVAVVLGLLLVVVLAGSDHGPSRHASGDGAGQASVGEPPARTHPSRWDH